MATQVCSSCGRKYTAANLAAESGACCPDCLQWSGQNPKPGPPQKPEGTGICGICLSVIEHGEPMNICPACSASYHEECWQENKGCAVYGCSETPPVEQRSSVEIPVSYWGQENKPCPACGKEILAAATRCRFCGATFTTAQPEDASAYNQRSERDKRLPQIRQNIIWIFVLSVIPCTAPIGGLWGLVWFATHRSDVKALPSLYSALCKIGIAVGLGQSVLMVLISVIYSTMHGS